MIICIFCDSCSIVYFESGRRTYIHTNNNNNKLTNIQDERTNEDNRLALPTIIIIMIIIVANNSYYYCIYQPLPACIYIFLFIYDMILYSLFFSTSY